MKERLRERSNVSRCPTTPGSGTRSCGSRQSSRTTKSREERRHTRKYGRNNGSLRVNPTSEGSRSSLTSTTNSTDGGRASDTATTTVTSGEPGGNSLPVESTHEWTITKICPAVSKICVGIRRMTACRGNRTGTISASTLICRIVPISNCSAMIVSSTFGTCPSNHLTRTTRGIGRRRGRISTVC